MAGTHAASFRRDDFGVRRNKPAQGVDIFVINFFDVIDAEKAIFRPDFGFVGSGHNRSKLSPPSPFSVLRLGSGYGEASKLSKSSKLESLRYSRPAG